MDYDLTGWRGVLWYGVQGSGLAVTNTSTSYNVFTFDLTTSKIPTNGLYELQVFGVTTNRTEEWARGRMSVRLNPSKGSLPPEWSSYPSFYGPLTNRISALESKTNDLNTVYSWGDHGAAGYMFLSSWLSWLGTNTYVKAETDSIALSALATNKTLRIFDPSDANRYIDGAGNKYVVSNFWEMTFSPDFPHPPAQPSYLFTSLTQSYYQYGSFGVYWMMSPTRVEWRGSNLGSVWVWEATTNAAVLQDGDYAINGFAYVNHWATTNLIGTLALESDISAHSTNATAHAALLAGKVSTVDATYTATVSRAASAYGWGNHASAGYLRQGESLFITEPGGGVLFPSESDAYALWLSYSGFRDSNDFFINLPPFSNISQTLATWQWTRSYVATNLPSGPGLPAVWTNMVWGASGTNSTYRMSWDVTNGTFKVEEILP
jgi:hypothetical protein